METEKQDGAKWKRKPSDNDTWGRTKGDRLL
jgi:hypothetical protein